MQRRIAATCGAALAVVLAEGRGLLTAAGTPVPIDVHFTLTDLDYKPIAGASVRLLFGDDPGKQDANAGYSFVTDAKGQHDLVVRAPIDRPLKKIPTNYVDSLTSIPKETDHLAVAAEFAYAGFRWLYALDLYRFRNGGDVMLEGMSVYNRDRQGRFTNKAVYEDRAWRMPDLKGLMLTTAGYDPWDYALQPKEGVQGAWTLKLAFKKHPEPVRR